MSQPGLTYQTHGSGHESVITRGGARKKIKGGKLKTFLCRGNSRVTLLCKYVFGCQ
jgi:hypothetical protein